MSRENITANDRKMTSIFERYLTVWVGLCIVGGIALGEIAPQLAKALDGKFKQIRISITKEELMVVLE